MESHKSHLSLTFVFLLLRLFAFCCHGTPIPNYGSVDSAASRDEDDDSSVTIARNNCEVLQLIADQAEKLGKERDDFLCPSAIKIVNDSRRIPKTLLELECINPQHEDNGKTYSCENISFQVPVLRKFQEPDWKWSMETVSVGCRAILRN